MEVLDSVGPSTLCASCKNPFIHLEVGVGERSFNFHFPNLIFSPPPQNDFSVQHFEMGNKFIFGEKIQYAEKSSSFLCPPCPFLIFLLYPVWFDYFYSFYVWRQTNSTVYFLISPFDTQIASYACFSTLWLFPTILFLYRYIESFHIVFYS